MLLFVSAVNVRWLLDDVPEVKKAVDDRRLCIFGTVESTVKFTGLLVKAMGHS